MKFFAWYLLLTAMMMAFKILFYFYAQILHDNYRKDRLKKYSLEIQSINIKEDSLKILQHSFYKEIPKLWNKNPLNFHFCTSYCNMLKIFMYIIIEFFNKNIILKTKYYKEHFFFLNLHCNTLWNCIKSLFEVSRHLLQLLDKTLMLLNSSKGIQDSTKILIKAFRRLKSYYVYHLAVWIIKFKFVFYLIYKVSMIFKIK